MSNGLKPSSLPQEVQDLGEPRTIYHGKLFLVWFCTFGGIGGFFIVVVAIVSLLSGKLNYDTPTPYIAMGFLVIGITLGSWLCYVANKIRTLRYVITPQGVVRVRNQEVKILRWDELSIYKQHAPSAYGAQFKYTLKGKEIEGQKQVVWKVHAEIEKPDKFGEEVSRRLDEKRLPELLKQLETGMPIMFNKVQISTLGIMYKDKFLRWSHMMRPTDVLVVGIGAKHVLKIIAESDDKIMTPWAEIPVRSVPNYSQLLFLVDVLRRHAKENKTESNEANPE